jgi:hypothetical protein
MPTIRRLAGLAGLAFSFIATSTTASDQIGEDVARSVARALELPYMKIYRGASCRPANVGERWYLKCSPSRDVVGGLWSVAPGPVLIAVNGKAQQHAENLEPVVDNDLNTVRLKEWRDIYPNEIPDVGAILKAYE